MSWGDNGQSQTWTKAYPTGANHHATKGWVDQQAEVKTKSYTLQKTFPSYSNVQIDEHHLAYEFSRMFADKFIEDNVITMQKDQKSNIPGEIRFRAEMTVAPGIKSLLQTNKVFIAYDQKWSENDIIKALKHTFPERLL